MVAVRHTVVHTKIIADRVEQRPQLRDRLPGDTVADGVLEPGTRLCFTRLARIKCWSLFQGALEIGRVFNIFLSSEKRENGAEQVTICCEVIVHRRQLLGVCQPGEIRVHTTPQCSSAGLLPCTSELQGSPPQPLLSKCTRKHSRDSIITRQKSHYVYYQQCFDLVHQQCRGPRKATWYLSRSQSCVSIFIRTMMPKVKHLVLVHYISAKNSPFRRAGRNV